MAPCLTHADCGGCCASSAGDSVAFCASSGGCACTWPVATRKRMLLSSLFLCVGVALAFFLSFPVNFRRCDQFRGHKHGYVFKTGTRGLGYYKDTHA